MTGASEAGLGRRTVGLLLALHLAGTVMELLGLFSLLPVFQYLIAGGNIAALTAEQEAWRILERGFGLIGVPLSLAALLVTTFALLLLRQGIVYFRLRYTASVHQKAVARLRMSMFGAFFHARLDAQERDGAGVVVNDMTTDLQNTIQYLMASIALAGVGIVLVGYMTALFVLSPSMTGVALALFGATYLVLRSYLLRTSKLGREFARANQSMSGFLVERLQQARLIRLAHMEAAEAQAMHGRVEAQRVSMTRIQHLLAAVNTVIEPIVVLAAFVFLYIGVTIFRQPLEALGLFMIVLMRLLPVVKEAVRTRQAAQSLHGSFTNVIGRLNWLRGEAEVHPGGAEMSPGPLEIAFKRVSFSYGGANTAALCEVDVTFPPGHITALVGPSGAGKSTLVDLLPRLRTPTSGEILFNGVRQDDIDLVALRAALAYAPQKPEMFNVSVREHIAYGKPDATLEEVKSAARLAQADAFVRNLPSGYDTFIGDGGARLSGGQRQRIDLARALVGGVPVLVLDEPTSNLDAESEAKFIAALRQIRDTTKTTLIVIAHRLSTVAMADQIVVLDAGRVRATGTHAELIHKDTWYRDAFETQQLAGAAPLARV